MSNLPRKIRFIINPKSGIGKQKIVERRIETYLDKAAFDYEICYTQAKAHAIELSREAAQMGYAAVIAVGGDGTVNEVAQGLLHTQTAMGIIPAGSGNGLAHFMKISLNVRKALQLINRFNVKTIDTGTINGRVFVSIAGVGFDAYVAERFSQVKTRGFWSYAKIAFMEYIRYNPKRFKIYVNERIIKTKSFMICVANSDQFGFNTRISPTSVIDDGLLNLCIIRKPLIYYAAFVIPFIFVGLAHKTPFIRIFKTTDVRIIQQKNNIAHIDGDEIDLGKELEVKVVPSSLKLIC